MRDVNASAIASDVPLDGVHEEFALVGIVKPESFEQITDLTDNPALLFHGFRGAAAEIFDGRHHLPVLTPKLRDTHRMVRRCRGNTLEQPPLSFLSGKVVDQGLAESPQHRTKCLESVGNLECAAELAQRRIFTTRAMPIVIGSELGVLLLHGYNPS